MVSRGVFQLKSVKLLFCDQGGSSKGVRSLLETEALDKFMEVNPQIQFEAIINTGNHPYIKTEYVNGWKRTIGLKNYSADQILEAFTRARSHVGRMAHKHSSSKVVSSNPSIQGGWRPNFWQTAHVFEDSKHEQLPQPPYKSQLLPVKPKKERTTMQFVERIMKIK